MLAWWQKNKAQIVKIGIPLAAAAATGGLAWTDAGRAFLAAILPMLGVQ